jgi:hypothetical protein
MDIIVKHNGVAITNYVISYDRVHKICTGIGTIDLEVSKTVGRTFDPWDTIDIHEEGDFKNRYYISQVDDSLPDGKIIINGQDKSKRLVDYFISDQYTIDYPSYTRTWIEQFLSEAGISYTFNTTSPGNLLSNFTSLGLTQAYEQILTLLQMSGWYMYFDGAGTAIIGDLNKNLSPVDASFTRSSILDISVRKDDKMLRNRALVLGNYDPLLNEQIVADVSIRTKWNYDSRDKRAIVISNSNIPNTSSAYGMANQLITEFSRITVEKHLVVDGTRDLQVGDVVRVSSDIFNGKGLITTFGISMSSSGLVTNLILDERCPRLFGFFDFGDYVYVGTYGDGIWRKHIKYDTTWYDFSSGLIDLGITDLHINNGIFSAVSASGQMYYNLADDTSWTQIQLDSLLSSRDDEIEVGSGIVLEPFSGIMARATMVDKFLGRIIYGVDTYSGVNYGDYFMTLSGMYETSLSGLILQASQVLESGWNSTRGWVLEYNVVSGFDTYNSYPITVSGSYDIQVLDVENDGQNDYVSVKSSKMDIIHDVGGVYMFGSHTAYNSFSNNSIAQDSNNIVSYSSADTFSDQYETVFLSDVPAVRREVFVFANDSANSFSPTERFLIYQRGNYVVYQNTALLTGFGEITKAITSGRLVVGVSRIGNDSSLIFNILYKSYPSPGSDALIVDFGYYTWNIQTDTLTDNGPVMSVVIPHDTNKTLGITELIATNELVKDGVYYFLTYKLARASVEGGDINDIENYVEFYKAEILMDSMVGTSSSIGRSNFPSGSNATWVDRNRIYNLSGNFSTTEKFSFLVDNAIMLSVFIGERSVESDYFRGHILNSLGFTSMTVSKILDEDGSIGGAVTHEVFQLTGERFFTYWYRAVDGKTITFNGRNVGNFIGGTPEFQWEGANIYPMFGAYDYFYIAKSGTNYYFCNPNSLELVCQINFDVRYSNIKPFLTSNSTYLMYFWSALDSVTGKYVILKTSFNGIIGTIEPYDAFSVVAFPNEYQYVAGNFFINIGPSGLHVLYANNVFDVPTFGTGFLVLQREADEFRVIQTASKPIRIDISNYAPLVTIQDTESTFNSFFIVGDNVDQYSMYPTMSGALADVMDYRYTLLPGSGELLSLTRQVVYLKDSDIFTVDAQTMSGIQLLYDIEVSGVLGSGILNCIETTNYAAEGQYIFVTSSGEFPQFYQKDAQTFLFVTYSGLPQSRATIIRIDDYL